MSIRRVVPNISSQRMNESRKFYCELLGFQVAMDMGWIMTLVSPANPTAQVSLASSGGADANSDSANASADPQMTLTIEVTDVDAVHAKAVSLGIPITYPIASEAWGVRRFGVRDPNGLILNVMSHSNARGR